MVSEVLDALEPIIGRYAGKILCGAPSLFTPVSSQVLDALGAAAAYAPPAGAKLQV